MTVLDSEEPRGRPVFGLGRRLRPLEVVEEITGVVVGLVVERERPFSNVEDISFGDLKVNKKLEKYYDVYIVTANEKISNLF